jgi:hypothetical protein
MARHDGIAWLTGLWPQIIPCDLFDATWYVHTMPFGLAHTFNRRVNFQAGDDETRGLDLLEWCGCLKWNYPA